MNLAEGRLCTSYIPFSDTCLQDMGNIIGNPP